MSQEHLAGGTRLRCDAEKFAAVVLWHSLSPSAASIIQSQPRDTRIPHPRPVLHFLSAAAAVALSPTDPPDRRSRGPPFTFLPTIRSHPLSTGESPASPCQQQVAGTRETRVPCGRKDGDVRSGWRIMSQDHEEQRTALPHTRGCTFPFPGWPINYTGCSFLSRLIVCHCEQRVN